jgi:hypothetical protein
MQGELTSANNEPIMSLDYGQKDENVSLDLGVNLGIDGQFFLNSSNS